MWDEQERFAKTVSKGFIGFLAVLGVVLTGISIATASPDFFLGFLFLLLALLGVSAIYGLVAVSIGGALLGVTSGVSYCIRWLQNRHFLGPDDRQSHDDVSRTDRNRTEH